MYTRGYVNLCKHDVVSNICVTAFTKTEGVLNRLDGWVVGTNLAL